MSRMSSSLTLFPNFIFRPTVNRVKRTILSTMQKASAGHMVRRLSRAGQTSTLPLCQPGRWVQLLVVLSLMMLGAVGIGIKSWEWVLSFYLPRRTKLLTLSSGELFLRSLLKALIMRKKHAQENAKFDATFSEGLRKQWSTMVQDWEHDKSNPNPYTHKEKGIFLLHVIVWHLVLIVN